MAGVCGLGDFFQNIAFGRGRGNKEMRFGELPMATVPRLGSGFVLLCCWWLGVGWRV